MSARGGNLYILTAAILGLTAGLLASVAIWPVRPAASSPRELSTVGQNAYRILIARAYNASGDSGRASSRLTLLDDGGSAAALSAQAQQALAAGHPLDEAEALARLASALGASQPGSTPATLAVSVELPTASSTQAPEAAASIPTAAQPAETHTPVPASPTASRTPTTVHASATPTADQPTPSLTPPPASGSSFTLLERSTECERTLERLLRVEIQDRQGNAFPGQGIEISGSEGLQVFYTGLKPRAGSGYADFRMQPGGVYNLRLAAGSETVASLTAPVCRAADGSTYEGSVLVIFKEK